MHFIWRKCRTTYSYSFLLKPHKLEEKPWHSVDQVFCWSNIHSYLPLEYKKNKPIELCCEYKLISESYCQKSFSSEPNNVVKYSPKIRFKNHQSPFKYQRIWSNLLVTLHISKTKVILYHWVHLNSEKITWSRWWKTEWHQKLPLFSLTKTLQKTDVL